MSKKQRRGSTTTTLTAITSGLVAFSLLAAGAATGDLSSMWSRMFGDEVTVEYLTTEVTRGPFVHSVLERGEIESSSNVEVRCEVRGRSSSSGTNILQIVPEGTRVEKGDFLVRLDDSLLETQKVQQQIVCSNSQSSVIEAKAKLDSARLELDEYAEGTFQEQLEQQQSEVFVAEENRRRAEEYLEFSKRLAERGYIPEAQLEADTFALEKAKKELGVAETKLNVLKTFTKQKMLTKLKADIETADAKLMACEKTWELDKKQLSQIEQQIEKCMINAPVAGQVVYANKQGSSSVIIEEGLPVRERQTIIQLPDPNKMQVVAKVHESRIGNVRPGLIADLKLDAVELELQGRVTEVSEYPLPAVSVYMSHVKEYEVMIEIVDPPADLRPGMTAQVDILVQQIDDALQVPIEAIVERNETFYCAVPHADGGLRTRKVKVGSANETDVIIKAGLREGEQIVLNIGDEEVLELLDLPEESES